MRTRRSPRARAARAFSACTMPLRRLRHEPHRASSSRRPAPASAREPSVLPSSWTRISRSAKVWPRSESSASARKGCGVAHRQEDGDRGQLAHDGSARSAAGLVLHVRVGVARERALGQGGAPSARRDRRERPERVGAHERLRVVLDAGARGRGRRPWRRRCAAATAALRSRPRRFGPQQRRAREARAKGVVVADRGARRRGRGAARRRHPARARASRAGGAKRLKGQTSWQTSHPKTHAPEARPQVAREDAPVLDGQVRDAAPRVEHVGRGEGVGGTVVEAARARAAVVLRRGRRRARARRRAGSRRGRPTSRGAAGAGRCSCRRSRGRRGRRPPARGGASGRRRRRSAWRPSTDVDERGAQRAKPRDHDVVVVAAPGVARDAAVAPLGVEGRRGDPVVDGDGHDRAHRREQRPWVGALRRIARHPAHVGGVPGGRPRLEVDERVGERLGGRDADDVEAVPGGERAQDGVAVGTGHRGMLPRDDQHRVAVGVEAVALAHRLGVRVEDRARGRRARRRARAASSAAGGSW